MARFRAEGIRFGEPEQNAAHAMHAAEDDLLTQIGIGAVYATPTVSTPTINL